MIAGKYRGYAHYPPGDSILSLSASSVNWNPFSSWHPSGAFERLNTIHTHASSKGDAANMITRFFASTIKSALIMENPISTNMVGKTFFLRGIAGTQSLFSNVPHGWTPRSRLSTHFFLSGTILRSSQGMVKIGSSRFVGGSTSILLISRSKGHDRC